ncbi:MAG: type II secretion system GspH family protein, partial [Proteobacteria bacterium]|nr:type II secretion system GspH family protein [Pseudomonadota bacterium]
KMKIQKMKQGGFTLLELLVVTAILAIIAGATISALSGKDEQAGAGVTVHTMAAVESATRQHNALQKEQPSNLESLLCVDNANSADTNAAQGNSLVFGSSAGADGSHGLTDDFQSKVALLTIPAEGVEALEEAGIEALQYVEDDYCNDSDADAGFDFGDGIEDDFESDEANSYVIFDSPLQFEGGRGIAVTVDEDNPADLLVHTDVEELGLNEQAFVVLLGVGNSSGLIANGYLARVPRDGNTEPVEAFSHYALAYHIGNDDGSGGGTADDGIMTGGEALGEARLVGVLDAGGDAYNEEILEAAGLEDEDG